MAKSVKKSGDKTSERSGNNKTWEQNHQLIQDVYLQLLKKHQKIPTIQKIADESKLSYRTTQKHLKELKLSDITPKAKIRAENVLMGITKKAELGDPSAAKLYFQLIFGWTEKQLVEHSFDMGKIDLSELSDDQLTILKQGIKRGDDPKVLFASLGISEN